MKNTSNHHRALRAICLAGTVAIALSACGTRHVSRDISPEGTAGEVLFPDVANAVVKEGRFPNIENLRSIQPGVTKDQLYQAIGSPHFREGMFGVREWDYLFHFQTDDGVATCQYKVIFDQDARGQSFHWLPASCADRLKPTDMGVATAAEDTRSALSTDMLFAFAKSGRDDILPDGLAELREVVSALSPKPESRIRIIGHTDRIGSETDNQQLSERRAETVRAFLVEHGVPATHIVAEGHGETMPVTTGCSDALAMQALIDCLKPDRRVELVVNAPDMR